MKALRSLFLLPLLFVSLLPLAQGADYTVTAANVVCSDDATIRRKVAGVAITQGQSLAVDTDGELVLFDANSGTAEVRIFAGIALNAAAAGQVCNYVSSDPSFTPGFTVAANAIVIGSATAGSLAPAADNATGWYLTIIGVGIGSNKINLNPFPSTVVTP